MDNLLEEIKREYKPYRLTKIKGITIINSTKGSYVIKPKVNNKVINTYNYLMSRNFNYFPEMVDNNFREDVNVFKYIEEIETPKEQKALDMMDIIALLHNKTTYYKEVSEDTFKEIYDNLNNNIIYTKNYYDNIYNIFITEVIPSPSHYLILRNIYKINLALEFCQNALDNWYSSIKEELKIRVALIHNNLEIEHFIRSDKEYLVSWDKAKIDSPILDMINLYQKEYMNMDFEPLIKKYLKNYPWKDSELKLFLIVISIPPIIELNGSEMYQVGEIRKKLDYVFKTEKLVASFNGEDK